MRKRWLVLGIAVLLANGPAAAAGLVVQVTDLHGRPIPDAVVSAKPRSRSPAVASRPAQVRVIDQKNLMFVPYIEVLRPGDAVVFRNSDGTRHHVYSFSPAKAFEFVLAPGQSSPPLTLATPGTVAVGCNIHDQMASYLVVSDAPWVATTGKDGRATFDAMPAATYTVEAWHPRLRPGRRNTPQASVAVPATGAATTAFTLSLLPDPRMRDHERMQY
jgi:plastocyanin